MKHSFSIILTMCIFMIIGVALIPRLDISNKPKPRQGKTINVSFGWEGASAKVIEQNVTSRIEGLCASVKGVESVSSESYFGWGNVTVELKKGASVSSAKFEIASLIRQVKGSFPQGVSYPEVRGGEVVTGKSDKEKVREILTYTVNANMPDRDIRKKIEKSLLYRLKTLDGVHDATVSDVAGQYLEISYDAQVLSLYGLTAGDLEDAIRGYMGKNNIIGDVMHPDDEAIERVKSENGSQTISDEHHESRITLFLVEKGKDLESMPVKTIDSKTVFLNNLAKCEIKDRQPNTYYRINGESTVYLNVSAEADANISTVANEVKDAIDKYKEDYKNDNRKLNFTLLHDVADEEMSEFRTLVNRSAMSLVILLLFVYLSRRSMKYFFIVTTTLLANILIAVICYWLFDMRLHPFSMAGITVSLGLIIDSTIVMVDHYSYHHDHKAFFGILGAMLTTIGSLIIIFWLPDNLKNDLYDFSWMVIINLAVAIIVAALFAPALVSRLNYSSRQEGKVKNFRLAHVWNRFYVRYLSVAQHKIMRWPLLILVAVMFCSSLYLFIDTLSTNVYQPPKEEMKLNIRAEMPLGGSTQELNEKVKKVEAFLSEFKQIKRYETQINYGSASIQVEFKPEYLNTSFPYLLENKVIGKVISIGGADWSTYGVSERGFSNSLDLQYRSNSIEIAGYDYERLYRYAEIITRIMSKNPRVQDIIIETPGHENQEDELFMVYDHERMAADSITPSEVHMALRTLLSESELGYCDNERVNKDIVLHSTNMDSFDQWQLENSFIKVGDRDIRVSDIMSIERREAKNCIPRRNQEYILRIGFNVLGSYMYTNRYMKEITDKCNTMFPTGFRCLNEDYNYYEEDGTQYWLIGLVVIIIFFVCSILFESLYQSLIIIMLIPTSMIGMFLTYHWGGFEFGTGGFASMVLLCGLTVNAGIYLINEYNNNGHHFIRAYNHKIIPILLTVLSTVLGLVPFLIDGPEVKFWFSFAIGSISGLIFSLLALVFIMPMMMKKGK